jgi:hypothetical protein
VAIDQDPAGLHQVLCLAAVQADGLDVALQALQAQVQDGLGRIGHGEQLARGLVHAHVGGLGREQHGSEQLEDVGVFQLGLGRGIGGLERGEEGFDAGGFHCGRRVSIDVASIVVQAGRGRDG